VKAPISGQITAIGDGRELITANATLLTWSSRWTRYYGYSMWMSLRIYILRLWRNGNRRARE